MPIPEDADSDKLVEVALAMLSLSAFRDRGGVRAWKGMDWDLLNTMYEKGWILDPRNKSKSVIFTEEGELLAREYFTKHFGGTGA